MKQNTDNKVYENTVAMQDVRHVYKHFENVHIFSVSICTFGFHTNVWDRQQELQ
jgi:hypothetical protein